MVYFVDIGLFSGHSVYFVGIWFIFPRFGILYIPRKLWQLWFGLVCNGPKLLKYKLLALNLGPSSG
jgi:hypothetical protein